MPQDRLVVLEGGESRDGPVNTSCGDRSYFSLGFLKNPSKNAGAKNGSSGPGAFPGDDKKRGSALVDTLESYLSNRRGISETARTLMVHRNTLRQRLDRIEKISGLALDEADLLALEIAIKLGRLG